MKFDGLDLEIPDAAAGCRPGHVVRLLAEAVDCKQGLRIAELGCGIGGLSLLLALHSDVEAVGFDVQPVLIEAAETNARKNHDRLQGTARFVCADIRDTQSLRKYRNRFECVVANPPFWRAGEGRVAPDPSRAASRHELAATLGDFMAAASRLLARRGQAVFILRPDRLAGMFHEADRAGCAIEAIRPIYTRPDFEAQWLIVKGRKSGRAGVRVLPPRELWRDRERA